MKRACTTTGGLVTNLRKSLIVIQLLRSGAVIDGWDKRKNDQVPAYAQAHEPAVHKEVVRHSWTNSTNRPLRSRQ
jgi:hypothetical protein